MAPRVAALDGLRGLAALVVVIHHSALVSPTLARAYGDGVEWEYPGWAEALLFSPLHLLWAGTEAVYIFFVLSGFVLTLPFLGSAGCWFSYYPRRIIRLYLPVWAAVIFTVALILLIPLVADGPAKSGLQNFEIPLTWGRVALDMVLVAGSSGYNEPLWSLQWEVLFSLLLPLYLWAGRRVGRWWMLAMAAAVIASSLGGITGFGPLQYLPMFAVGVLMAMHRDELAAWAARVTTMGWSAVAVLACLALMSGWWMPWLRTSGGVALVGAGLVVALFLLSPGAQRLGSATSVQWLGVRSFSLYLIHQPIVVSFAQLLPWAPAGLVLLMALPASLLAADLFFRAAEGPSHHLSSAVGRRLRAIPTPG